MQKGLQQWQTQINNQTTYVILDSGTILKALAVDGGMSNSDVCMQVGL